MGNSRRQACIEINQKNLRIFAHHKPALLLSSLTTPNTTKMTAKTVVKSCGNRKIPCKNTTPPQSEKTAIKTPANANWAPGFSRSPIYLTRS
jgi:hypothetical protein